MRKNNAVIREKKKYREIVKLSIVRVAFSIYILFYALWSYCFSCIVSIKYTLSPIRQSKPNTSDDLRGQLNRVCVFVCLSFHLVGNSSPTSRHFLLCTLRICASLTAHIGLRTYCGTPNRIYFRLLQSFILFYFAHTITQAKPNY